MWMPATFLHKPTAPTAGSMVGRDATRVLFADEARLMPAVGLSQEKSGLGVRRANDHPTLGSTVIGCRQRILDDLESQRAARSVRSGFDGVFEGIAVGVLAYETGVDDVRGLCGESRDAAGGTDRCAPDVGVIVISHGCHHHRRSGGGIDLPGTRP